MYFSSLINLTDYCKNLATCPRGTAYSWMMHILSAYRTHHFEILTLHLFLHLRLFELIRSNEQIYRVGRNLRIMVAIFESRDSQQRHSEMTPSKAFIYIRPFASSTLRSLASQSAVQSGTTVNFSVTRILAQSTAAVLSPGCHCRPFLLFNTCCCSAPCCHFPYHFRRNSEGFELFCYILLLLGTSCRIKELFSCINE